MDHEAAAAVIHTVFGPVELSFYSEGDIALATAGLHAGVSLVAGTGSSCRIIDDKGRVTSCGGFGPQFDDEGSAYWIGREAIAAAVRAEDGRGRVTALREAVLTEFRIDTLWDIHGQCDHNGHLLGPRVAAFAAQVFAAARSGDVVAQGLCEGAGQALADLIVATVRRAHVARRPMPLVMTGGVFYGGELIVDPLTAQLDEGPYSFDVLPPVVEPAHGIFKLIQDRQNGGTQRVHP